jgi:hypothetical protein
VHGAVRVAGSLAVIMPDPERAVDYVIHTPALLDPEVLLNVVARELPGARLASRAPTGTGRRTPRTPVS